MAAITRQQLALLHVAKKQLGLRDVEYRELLQGAAGVESAADLDHRGYDAVMDALKRAGFKPRLKPQAAKAVRPGMATPAQLGCIRAIGREMGWDTARLTGLVRRVVKVDGLSFLTRAQAGVVIETLKSMAAGGRGGDRKGGGAA